MSEALIGADMFSNSPQERPTETVTKKTRPRMVPCNISYPPRQMSPDEGEIVGVIRKKKQKAFWAFFEPTKQADVIVSILHDRPN